MSTPNSDGPELRTMVTFESTAPDDRIEEDGDVVVPAGRGIMSTIRAGLVSNGWPCLNVFQRSHYGWEFDVADASRRTTLVLQDPGPWLLMVVQDGPSLWQVLRGSTQDDIVVDLLRHLHAVLVDEPSVSNVRWHTDAEYEKAGAKGGAAEPV